MKSANFFQAVELYEHCVEQFKGGLRVMMQEQGGERRLFVFKKTATRYKWGECDQSETEVTVTTRAKRERDVETERYVGLY